MGRDSFVINGISMAHRFTAPMGWVSGEYAKTRPQSGLVYVLEGSAVYEMASGECFTAIKDDLLYMEKGTPYITHCPDEPFLHMTVNFSAEGGLQLPRARHCTETERTRIRLSQLVSEWTLRRAHYYERCLGMLYLIICDQLDTVSRVSGDDDKLKNAMAIISEQENTDIPVNTLALSCGMSETYFRRLFTRTYGMAPTEYIAGIRLRHACELLVDTDYGIEEIGFICGYQDPAYFSRIFHRKIGMTPSAYRMSGRQNNPD